MTACQWLYQLDSGQEATWGTEATALAAVARTGVPVLPGFVLSREAVFAYFMQPDMRAGIMRAAKPLSVRKPELFAGAAKEIRRLLMATPLPKDIRKTLGSYLEELEDQVLLVKGKGLPLTCIADGPTRLVSHAHPATLAAADKMIRELLTQLFTEHALYSRYEQEQPIVPTPVPVLIQYAPASTVSGIAQLYDPVQHDGTVLWVEVAHHEHASSHALAPADTYRFDLKTLALYDYIPSKQHWGKTKHGKHVTHEHTGKALLDERQLRLLARLVKRAHEPFSALQVFHWQLHLDAPVLSGVMPFVGEGAPIQPEVSATRIPLVTGHPAVLGKATGTIHLINQKKDWDHIPDGAVVVAEQISETHLKHLPGVAALITESGHWSSEETHLAQRLAIPAITGAGAARNLLREGSLVTVDGTHGAVYAGRLRHADLQPLPKTGVPITGTKIYASVEDPLIVTPALLQNADGIGMLRGEFILRLLGVHPHEILHHGMAGEYVELLVEGVERALRAAGHKPVIYQLHDLAEHTFHGWHRWRRENHEPNRLIGYRGTHRLLSEPEMVALEVDAIQQLIRKGYENLHIMLPMVRSVAEFHSMQKLLKKHGASDVADRLWVRVETPSLLIRAEALAEAEPAGVLFDAGILSTLITGVDKDNHQVGHHRDHTDPAVAEALTYAIGVCRKAGISTAVTTEGELIRPELVETAVRAGVTAVCVQPDESAWLHSLLASVEQRMLLDHLVEEEK